MVELILGIIATLIGAIIIGIIKGYHYYLIGKGPLNGTFEQYIPPHQGEPEKRDLVACKQIGNTVKGTVIRREPSDQKGKEWKFKGRAYENLFAVVYWAIEPTASDSFGSWLMKHTGENKWEGKYFRIRQVGKDLDQIIEQKFQIPIEWDKLK